ncbi:CesT family type III secretion system chaperone [Pseudomonas viridiflava]|uniref:CesT family type III secretion system chaperone n=1 Tax=Pseudomonas viridiflava TaxID=33069 RepID=UPI00177AD588|nr:CesT family type III secretion system chaperone [Pseudomonas viridiflava]MBD8200705.1 CesT family type III secretion system chaperone [Pseudomonas viridiflava]
MNNYEEQYKTLINEICALSLISSPERFYESANFKIDDVDFTLQYQNREQCRAVLIYGDMGPLPERNRDQSLLALMDTNFHLFSGAHSPVFSFNAQTGRVLLMGSVALEMASAEGILLLMKSFAELAGQWRQHGFIAKAAGDTARSSAPVPPSGQRDVRPAQGRFQ